MSACQLAPGLGVNFSDRKAQLWGPKADLLTSANFLATMQTLWRLEKDTFPFLLRDHQGLYLQWCHHHSSVWGRQATVWQSPPSTVSHSSPLAIARKREAKNPVPGLCLLWEHQESHSSPRASVDELHPSVCSAVSYHPTHKWGLGLVETTNHTLRI